MTIYILADPDEGAEMIAYTSDSYGEVLDYQRRWPLGDRPNYQIYMLTRVYEVENPIQGPIEPPGWRFKCPHCSYNEYKQEFAEWRRFVPVTITLPGKEVRRALVCPECHTVFEVEFK